MTEPLAIILVCIGALALIGGGLAMRRARRAKRAPPRAEVGQWIIEELGHALSGGAPEGPFTDACGPDVSREIVRFFLGHPMLDRCSQGGG
jgi:hypothetical protein